MSRRRKRSVFIIILELVVIFGGIGLGYTILRKQYPDRVPEIPVKEMWEDFLASRKEGEKQDETEPSSETRRISRSLTPDNCKIDGIIYSSKNPSVMLGGETYHVNENVCGGKIVKITRDTVTIRFAEGEKILGIKTAEEPSVRVEESEEMAGPEKSRLAVLKDTSQRVTRDVSFWFKRIFRQLQRYNFPSTSSYVEVPKKWVLSNPPLDKLAFPHFDWIAFRFKPENNPCGKFYMQLIIGAEKIPENLNLGNDIEKYLLVHLKGLRTQNAYVLEAGKANITIRGNESRWIYYTVYGQPFICYISLDGNTGYTVVITPGRKSEDLRKIDTERFFQFMKFG